MDQKPILWIQFGCDDSPRVWHVIPDISSSRIDLPTPVNRKFFRRVQEGSLPLFRPNVAITNHHLIMFYYLADWKYPRFVFIALPRKMPRTAKEREYTKCHSSARKEVKRVFYFKSLHFWQFNVLAFPCHLVRVKGAVVVMQACCDLRIMIPTNRGYKRTLRFRRAPRNNKWCSRVVLEVLKRAESRHEQVAVWRESLDEIEDLRAHGQRMDSLRNHILSSFGDVGNDDEQAESEDSGSKHL